MTPDLPGLTAALLVGCQLGSESAVSDPQPRGGGGDMLLWRTLSPWSPWLWGPGRVLGEQEIYGQARCPSQDRQGRPQPNKPRPREAQGNDTSLYLH